VAVVLVGDTVGGDDDTDIDGVELIVDDGTVAEYELKGAGAVRNEAGSVLTQAATLQIGLAGDSVTSTHPVVDGVAIADARVTPQARVHFADWNHPPVVEGKVLDADGKLLATCRS
jgi:hypothetical protein